jgi:shikimate dehydrogenase
MGQNISYSFSKGYFTDKFNNENFIGCTYFDIQEIDSFTEILKNNADLKVECDSYNKRTPFFT